MSYSRELSMIEQRRDTIREWLDEEAPYAAADQKNLDAHTPERAYWHFGYQAALSDVLGLFTTADENAGNVDNPN